MQVLAAQRRAESAAAPARSALALGMVGSLGEELLAQLVGGTDYRVVHVGVTQPIGSASSRFRPWVVGVGVVVAEDAFLCVADADTFVPAGTPIRVYSQSQVLPAAQLARQCGVSTFVVIAPLGALLQMSRTATAFDPHTEVALREVGFERLVIVTPTATDVSRARGLGGMVRALGRTLADIMLPGYTRALTAQTAARALLEAVREAPPGVTIVGARELRAIVDAKFPAKAPKSVKIR
jgi:hypothetical protein